tara:strand:+ start:4405 stop:5655 length:1251 start_codon:yes stop_codon:yes gene_type:complete
MWNDTSGAFVTGALFVYRRRDDRSEMADFHQQGPITTLHRLTDGASTEALSFVSKPSVGRGVALVLPCLITELEGSALPEMVRQISDLGWLGRVIIGVDGANADSFQAAQTLFASLPQPTTVIWNDSESMASFDQSIGLPSGTGKGRNLWRCFGAAAAYGDINAVVVHDADISTYDSAFVARLAHPVVDDRLGFDFVKGFYPRFDHQGLNGRVTRLLVGPLLESLASSDSVNPSIRYLQSFRYPLAGEFAARASLTSSIAMPAHWGVDISLLANIHSLGVRVAQTDLTDRYDHKHQILSPDDPESGLHRMARDIISTLVSISGRENIEGPDFDARLDHALLSHRSNAISNAIPINSDAENSAAKLFAELVRETQTPLPPNLPSWKQLSTEFPNCIQELMSAVESQSISDGATDTSP